MEALIKLRAGPGHVALADVPEPSPLPHQVKLQVSACGICGTDLHVLHDTFRNFPPVILGHEFVGRVVAEGSEVRGRTDPARAYAVLGATAITCGACEWCRSGNFMFCPSRRGMGHGVNGAFARYVCVRPDQLFALGPELPEEEGALIEPLAVAVHAVCEIATVRAGDIALVSGCGPIGMLCLLLLVQQGVRTVVTGTAHDAERLVIARSLGAARTIDVTGEDIQAVLREETRGAGVDIAFEAAGAAESAAACLESLKPLGQYIQVGHFGQQIRLPLDLAAFRQLRMAGSVGYTEATWRRTLGLVNGGLSPSRIVSHRLPLARWEEGFQLFSGKQALKVLITLS